jgi:hypothetical protein
VCISQPTLEKLDPRPTKEELPPTIKYKESTPGEPEEDPEERVVPKFNGEKIPTEKGR